MKTTTALTASLLMSVMLLVTGCATHKLTGKHLFILAGQSNMSMLNPDDRFIPTLAEEFGAENIIVVKDGYAGARIQRWYKQWKTPLGESYQDSGDIYDRLINKVREATQDQTIATITFVWMQGESDGVSEYYAGMYEKNMLGLYAQLQEDLQWENINWVIGRISDFDMHNRNFKRWTKIRDIQEKVAASSPRFALVDTDDLNDGIMDPKRKKDNDLHYSEAGYQILGQRFADSAIKLIVKNDN